VDKVWLEFSCGALKEVAETESRMLKRVFYSVVLD